MKNKHPFWMKLDWRGARPLTLRELIMKSDFNAMMKCITNFHKKMIGQEPHFYRACECIRDMRVKVRSEDYFLAKYDPEYDVPYIGVLEGISWSENLGYPVKRDKDLHCTDTELAAHCLWHLTFYGYTPEEQRENARKYMENVDRQERNDEVFLADDLYSDDYIRECALSGRSRIRDEVLERLFTPEEIVEIKKRRKERLDAENAERDVAEEEERKQLEQDAALKLELRKEAEEERRKKWYRERRRKRQHNKPKK
jgi:hypothetical protein